MPSNAGLSSSPQEHEAWLEEHRDELEAVYLSSKFVSSTALIRVHINFAVRSSSLDMGVRANHGRQALKLWYER